MANCAYHPKRDAVGACVNCGRLVCAECKTVLGEKIYCNLCANTVFTTRVGTGIGGVPPAGNTSGQGSSAVIPKEIGGWNWGAFLLGWIWGVGNSVWIGLLTLIPYLGFIMNIILGVKGSEWAWRYKRWDGVEHFKRTQSTWTKWGVGIVLGVIALVILIIILVVIAGSQYSFY
jgi:hypothetical protein